MRVLLISQDLVDPLNREKWNMLATKEGIEMYGVAPSKWIENYRTLEFRPSPQDVFPVKSLNVIWPGKENRAFFLRGLLKVIRESHADIILCFEEPGSLFALQAVFLRAAVSSKSKLAFYTWDNRGGQKSGYRPSFFYDMLKKLVLKHVDILMTANEEADQYYRTHYGFPVRKLYYGIPLRTSPSDSRAASEARTGGHGSLVVGYVGRLLEMKGIETLIRAVPLVDESVRVLILGNGPDRERLKSIVEDLSLLDRVSFISAVSSEEVRNVMSRLDVLVLPSRTTDKWKEQYGKVLIEAMAGGVPVIGSSSGAIPEVIGDAGLVFNEGDSRELARLIESVRTDLSLRTKLTQAGKARASTFSTSGFSDSALRYIREVMVQ